MVECVWNVMAHAQKPDIVFRRNGRVHLNRRGRQFSRLLAAEMCASALIMLDTTCYEVVWEYWPPTPFASFPFTPPPVRYRVPSGFKRTLAPIGKKFPVFREQQILLPCLQQRLAGSSSKPNGSLPQSLTSLIQDTLQFFFPIDTRIFHVTSFLQVSKSNFHTIFFLSFHGACHSNIIFLWSYLCYHVWKNFEVMNLLVMKYL